MDFSCSAKQTNKQKSGKLEKKKWEGVKVQGKRQDCCVTFISENYLKIFLLSAHA